MVGSGSALAGMTVLVIAVPLNFLSTIVLKKLQSSQMKAKDQRVKVTSEMLQGIKAVKLNAWEDYFLSKLSSIRLEEINCMKGTAKIWATLNSFFSICPALVTLAAFATFVNSDPENNTLTGNFKFNSYGNI